MNNNKYDSKFVNLIEVLSDGLIYKLKNNIKLTRTETVIIELIIDKYKRSNDIWVTKI